MLSDSTLETIRTKVKARGARRDQRYRGNLAHSVSGLAACKCHGQRIGGRGLRGYRVALLNQRTGLSGLGAATDVALVPVSDKTALMNAVKYFARVKQNKTLAGFGAMRFAGLGSEQATGAASGAAAGAKAGSIVPGIGTVIGAVVGAVVGWLSAKPKPVRATAEQVAQCKAMLTEYMGYAAQSPDAPLPMEWTQLLDLNWCTNAVYGAEVGNKDPRFFNPGFESGTRAVAIALVKKIYETPVGQTVNLDAISFKSPSGRVTNFGNYSFVNPVFTNLKTFSAQYFEAAELSSCKANAGKGAGGCESFTGRAERKRLLYDLLAWAARTTLPNISESDLAAASQVAATTGTAAKDVVSAVEQIIARNVVKGETSALLTGQTDVPGVVAPTVTVAVPTATSDTGTTVTTQAAADVTALIQQLVTQNASTQAATQAALNALAAQGTTITPAVTESVEKEIAAQQVTQAGGLSSNALLTGGGILAALFLLGRPAKRGSRR